MITYSRKENIHLSDEQLYDLIKQNFRDGYYESAINLMETNPQLDEKLLGQIAYNSMQNNLKVLQEQNDPDFKKDLIPLSYEKPTDLPINKIWFKITKEEKAVVEKTYAELLNLKQNNQLEVGNIYLLKDYVTKYQQPVSNTMKVGKYDLATVTPSQIEEESEPLLLQAISKSEFAVECYSFKYPEDIIYYDFNDNICEDGSTPRNGFILRRYWVKNEVNVPNDWRHIKWARWVNPNRFNLLSFEKQLTDKQEYYTFSKADGSSKTTYLTHNIEILGNSRRLLNTVFYGDGYNHNITAGGHFERNTLGDSNYVMTFGNYCYENTFGKNCSFSTYNDNFYSNTLNNGCTSNFFGAICFENTLGSSCIGNVFSNRCFRNVIEDNNDYNIFGTNFHNNKLGSLCRCNTFGSSCVESTFGSRYEYNTIGSDCRNNIFGSDCQFNTIDSNCNGNIFGSGCDVNHLGAVEGCVFGDNFIFSFVKKLYGKNVSQIEDIHLNTYTITYEQMSNGQYCYWYKTGTSASSVTTVVIP